MNQLKYVAQRTAVAAVTASTAVLVFPHVEDAYWFRTQHSRVVKDKEDNNDMYVCHKPKVVVLGTGWASIAALNNLDRDKYESITVVSPRNCFLFTPLLPCTAVGTLSHNSIAIPIRDITSYKGQSIYQRLYYMWRGYLPPTIEYAYAYASDIDPITKTINCQHSGQFPNHTSDFTLEYDKLILSVGCKTNTWNTPGVEEHCHYLKESGDAILLRQQLIENLELASLPHMSEENKNRLLSFFIVGGGPTGVELAAELSDLLHEDIANPTHSFFRGVKADMSNVSVTLVQSAPKLLPGFPHQIQDFCKQHLGSESQVDVLLNTRVTGVSDTTMELYDKHTKTKKEVPYGMVVWTAGVQPTDLARSLITKINSFNSLNSTNASGDKKATPLVQNSTRAIQTDSHCRVMGAPDILAVGDCADIVLLPEYLKSVTELFHEKLTRQPQGMGADEWLASNPPPPVAPPVLQRSSPTQRLVARVTAVFSSTKKPVSPVSPVTHLMTPETNQEFLQELKKSWEHYSWVCAEKIVADLEQLVVEQKTQLDFTTVEQIVEQRCSRQKHLPPTAQVAQQQGQYVATLLNNNCHNNHDEEITSFQYQNHGQLVYAGAHVAALALPGTNDIEVTWAGTATNVAWHAAYFGMLESTAGRYELAVDWLKSYVFGRSVAVPAICTDNQLSHTQALTKRGATTTTTTTTNIDASSSSASPTTTLGKR